MALKKKPGAQQILGAINKYDIQRLQELLEAGADPNAMANFVNSDNTSMLMSAAGIQFVEGVQLLLAAGANVNHQSVTVPDNIPGGTALHRAIYGTDTRRDVNNHSTENDRLVIIDMLLEAGADPNILRNNEEPPIYTAATSGNLEACERLIQAGAAFSAMPAGASPPLFGAAIGVAPYGVSEGLKQERVAQHLLAAGAPVDGECGKGRTPLMAAALQGSERLVDLFLAHGANVNHRANNGATPLIWAGRFAPRAFSEDEEQIALRIMQRLVEKGADITAKNDEGDTAHSLAARARFQAPANYLQILLQR